MAVTLSLFAAVFVSVHALDNPPAPVQEVEPNQTRPTASPATPLAANLYGFSGTCRGFLDDPVSIATDTRDLWRVTIPANPLLIQRHRLQITTTGTQGHTGSLLGVQSTNGVIDPASMVALQNTSISTVPARYCMVYTLGAASPDFLFRVTGSSGTTLPYTATLSSETVTPTAIRPCPFLAGSITLTTVGRTSLNTKLFLYNADTLAPIEDGINDDTPVSPGSASGSPQSTLTRTLAPGRYIVAVANGGTADHRPPPADDRLVTQPIAYLAETPGVLVNSSSTATGDFSFKIVDAMGETPVTAAKPGAFGVVFYKFETKTRCGLADVGAAGGQSCFDTLLDNNDFIVFVNSFFASSPTTDIGVAGGFPGSDAKWDNNDWIVFLNQFFEGCAG